MTTSTAKKSNHENEYFNSKFIGEGYLNRIRVTANRKADPTWSVTCAFPKGKRKLDPGEKRETYYIDTNVHGAAALELIQKLHEFTKNDKNASIYCSRIEIGDMWNDKYQSKPDADGKSETKPLNKGRLLILGSIWVNGHPWYTHKKAEDYAIPEGSQFEVPAPTPSIDNAIPEPSSIGAEVSAGENKTESEPVNASSSDDDDFPNVAAKPVEEIDPIDVWITDVVKTQPLKLTLRKADVLFHKKIDALKAARLYKWDKVEGEELRFDLKVPELKKAS